MSDTETLDAEKKKEEEDKSSPGESSVAWPSMSDVVEGKRMKKTVERLEFQLAKPKEKLKVGDGMGDKLGEIPRTNHMIGKLKPTDLKPLHSILFDRPGKIATMRKSMRLFNGFPFEVNSEPYARKREKLLRTSSLTNAKLRVICNVLDLEKKGMQVDLVDRILSFLTAPKNSGKPLLKKKKSKKKLSGSDSKTKTKSKPRPKSTSASPKKTKAESKSKAIVMDSSSDEEEEEEEEEEANVRGEAEGSDRETKGSKRDKERSDQTEESGDKEEVEEEPPRSKAGRGKAAPKNSSAPKRKRTPAKNSAPPRKKVRKEPSDGDSEEEEDYDNKPKKKKAAPGKPAAKTKKADSSSKEAPGSADSSDDDRPLIKMIRKVPSDEQLKDTVQTLLQDANLEEMTMKQICQRVYDTYPDYDLINRKDYIKQTVKSLIT